MKFENITLSYQDKIVVKDVNLSFPKAKLCALIGPSGSGKSTLLNSIFNHSIIKIGILKFNNKNVKDFNNKELKKFKQQIYYLKPENNLIEDLDFYQNLMSDFKFYKNKFYKLFKILTKKQKEELFALLSKLSMQEYAFEKITKLSSGQKQRLSIAKMLFNKPKIILADEPTSNLDIVNTKLIFDLLNEYKLNAHIIVAIHDLNSALKHFDKFFVFSKNDTKIKELNKQELNIRQLTKYYE